MYIAIVRFADAQDDNYIYEVGDVYPREGFTATEERIEGLLTRNNGAGKPVIVGELSNAPEIVAEPEAEEIIEEEPETDSEPTQKPKKGK